MNILDNFASPLFYFHTFGVRRPLEALNQDPVRMNPNPGWFSGSRTAIGRLTQKNKNTKKKTCKIPRKFFQWYFEYFE